MRVTTKAVFDIESGDLLEWEGYDYEDPVELACGGPSAAQKARIQSAGNVRLLSVGSVGVWCWVCSSLGGFGIAGFRLGSSDGSALLTPRPEHGDCCQPCHAGILKQFPAFCNEGF